MLRSPKPLSLTVLVSSFDSSSPDNHAVPVAWLVPLHSLTCWCIIDGCHSATSLPVPGSFSVPWPSDPVLSPATSSEYATPASEGKPDPAGSARYCVLCHSKPLPRTPVSRAESVCQGVVGRPGSRLVARVPAQFQNILGHRSHLYCEAALKQMGALNAVGHVLRLT